MEIYSLYDIKKEEVQKSINNYKKRKKVINKRINENRNKELYIVSFLMILGGITTIGNAELLKDVIPYADYYKIAGASLIGLSPLVAHYGKDKSKKQEIHELKQMKQEINKSIKEKRNELKSSKKLKKVLEYN